MLEENPPLNVQVGGTRNAMIWKITAILNWDPFIHYLLEDASGIADWDMWTNLKYWPISYLNEVSSVKENLSKDSRFQDGLLKQESPKYEEQLANRQLRSRQRRIKPQIIVYGRVCAIMCLERTVSTEFSSWVLWCTWLNNVFHETISFWKVQYLSTAYQSFSSL
jgi:hypothetical protein